MSGKPSWQKRLQEVRLNPTPKLKSNNDPANVVTPTPAPVPPVPAPAPKPDLTQADMRLLEEMLGRVHDPLIAEPPKASAPAQPATPQPMSTPAQAAPAAQKVAEPSAPPLQAAKSTAPAAKKAAPPQGNAKKPPTDPAEDKEGEEAKPKPKSRVRKWAFLTVGLIVAFGLVIVGLMSLPDSRNFLFSFSNLTQREERYYNEVTALNVTAQSRLNEAYPQILSSYTPQQAEAYKRIYTGFGEVSAKFLAMDSPSLRFEYPHAQLRKLYLQYEALSKQMLQTLNTDPKTIDRTLVLQQLDALRTMLEQGKADLRAAANR